MNPIIDESMVNQTMVVDRTENASGPSIDRRLVENTRPKKSVLGRLLRTLMLIVVLAGGTVFALYKTRVNIPGLNSPKVYANLDSMVASAEQIKGRVVGRYESYFHKHEEEAHHEAHKIIVTSPMQKDVTITQEYVCLIHSQNHIDVCALQDGYLEAIPVKEGQEVKKDEVMFKVISTLYQARLDAEVAERDLALLELNNTKRLADSKGVSQNEVKLFEAKLAKAQAKVDLARAELNFATVKAPFDGIIDRLRTQQGSLVKEGDILTTLSDNRVMWVYFNVTEKRYLEYMAETGQNKQSPDIHLRLANHSMFPQVGWIGAIESNFNRETGNIEFRADFPNPINKETGNRLLRNGQTGTVLIDRPFKGAIVIPQRATFENLAKRYVYIVNEEGVVHQQEIAIGHEMDDIYIIEKGVKVTDKIVLEGIRQVHDGEKVEFDFRDPKDVMKDMKNHAE